MTTPAKPENRFYFGGSIYENWASVPQNYKLSNSRRAGSGAIDCHAFRPFGGKSLESTETTKTRTPQKSWQTSETPSGLRFHDPTITARSGRSHAVFVSWCSADLRISTSRPGH